MQTETITCGGCGAPLSIPDNVKYVACRFCQAQLHVQRNQSVVFTEVLQSLQKQTERLADNTEVLRLQNEIAMLDREWDQQSAGLMLHGKHGSVSAPEKSSAIIGAVVIVSFGFLWTGLACAMFPPFALFGLLFVGLGVRNCFKVHADAERYEQLQTIHQSKRNKLLEQLRQSEPRN